MDFAAFQSTFLQRIAAAQFLVEQTNKSSILVIQQFPTAEDTEILLPAVRESISNIIAFVELGDLETLKYVFAHADGTFDAIAMDSDAKHERSRALIDYVRGVVTKAKVFYYSDTNVWAESALTFIQHVEKGLNGKNILIAGTGILVTKLLNNLSDYGTNLFYLPGQSSSQHQQLRGASPTGFEKIAGTIDDSCDLSGIDLLIGASIKQVSVDDRIAQRLPRGINIYDMGIGNFSADFIVTARDREDQVYRLDNRAGISSMVLSLFETDYLITKMMGTVCIKDVELVSGGILGCKGAVIVDNVYKPTYVIGIADGKGRVNFTPETAKESEDLLFVKRLIAAI